MGPRQLKITASVNGKYPFVIKVNWIHSLLVKYILIPPIDRKRDHIITWFSSIFFKVRKLRECLNSLILLIISQYSERSETLNEECTQRCFTMTHYYHMKRTIVYLGVLLLDYSSIRHIASVDVICFKLQRSSDLEKKKSENLFRIPRKSTCVCKRMKLYEYSKSYHKTDFRIKKSRKMLFFEMHMWKEWCNKCANLPHINRLNGINISAYIRLSCRILFPRTGYKATNLFIYGVCFKRNCDNLY